MKYLVLTLAFLILSILGSAKKMVLSIVEIAARADIIVTGEIISVENGQYNLKVSDAIKGTGRSVIKVQQFKEWACDSRYAKVQRGQKLFLFLKKVKNKLEIINGSNGEIPIIDNKVTLKNESYSHKNYTKPYRMGLDEFKAGIKGFIQLFAIVEAGNERREVHYLQKSGNNALQAFMATSDFAKWICEKLQEHYRIVKS